MEKFAILHQYTDIGIFVLRAAVALIFLVHGFWKIKNSPSVAKSSGMPESDWFFMLLGWIETLAALALLSGIFTQAAAALLGLIMIGAIYFKVITWKIPFTAHDKTGWELDLIILAACVFIVFAGAGRIALDKTIFALY